MDDRAAREDYDPDNPPTPVVGMGCTMHVGSDSYPYTIVSIDRFKGGPRKGQPKEFWMTRDVSIRTDDRGYFTEWQDYRYELDDGASSIHVTLRSDGKWKVAGDTQRITVGYRLRYNDPSF